MVLSIVIIMCGAISIPLPSMVSQDPRLADARTIVVYDVNWQRGLARAGAKKLIALGYKNVAAYPGGLDEWTQHAEATAE